MRIFMIIMAIYGGGMVVTSLSALLYLSVAGGIVAPSQPDVLSFIFAAGLFLFFACTIAANLFESSTITPNQKDEREKPSLF